MDDDSVARIGLDAMMKSLKDPCLYLPPAEYQRLFVRTVPVLGSVGLVVGKGATYPLIQAVVAGSPAAIAHVEPRGELRQLDGQDLAGVPAEEVTIRFDGPVGSTATLVVGEPNREDRTISLTRAFVDRAAVDCRILQKRILYLGVHQIGYRTPAEVERLGNSVGSKATRPLVILDLRANPGGLLESVHKLADLFVRSGPLYTTRFLRSVKREAAKPEGSILEQARVAVLVDGTTVSGAEVVAAALMDTHRGTLLGGRTAGKAEVNTVVEAAGGAVKFVVAELQRGSGGVINGVGVDPDIVVSQQPSLATSFSDEACPGVVSTSPVVQDPVVARAVAHLLALASAD